MKIKLGLLLASVPALREMSAFVLPVRTSFALGQSIKIIQKHLDEHDSQLKKILERHIQEKDGAKQIKDMDAYQKDVIELRDIMVDIKVEKISLKTFGDNKMSIGSMSNLDWLLKL